MYSLCLPFAAVHQTLWWCLRCHLLHNVARVRSQHLYPVYPQAGKEKHKLPIENHGRINLKVSDMMTQTHFLLVFISFIIIIHLLLHFVVAVLF